MKNKRGLYIHIPFCRHICNYCDFFKMVASLKYQDKYIDYLIKDLNMNYEPGIKTIYIGGGTPSSLSTDNLIKMLSAIEKILKQENILEYTIEINPEDITPELIGILKQFSINRISIGIQTFNLRLQKIINRYSDYEDIKSKIDLLKDSGFDNINLDLMYGISDETMNELIEDLNKFLSLGPKHISTYSLILEEKTVLYYQYEKGYYTASDDDLESLMYDQIRKILQNSGFIYYETSNFAIPTYESKHNLIYWSNEEYLGIGAGSSGYLKGIRYKNTTRIDEYYEAIDNNQISYIEKDVLSKQDIMDNEIMLGLRKVKGINLDLFYEKYQVQLLTVYPSVKILIESGFLEKLDNHIKIKDKFHYISNAILSKIL